MPRGTLNVPAWCTMSMFQIVIGAALGVIAAEVLLFGFRQLAAWLQAPAAREWLADMNPSQRFAAIGGFGRYAALVLGCAALITLALWGTVNYLATRSERREALAAAMDPAAALQAHSPEDAQALGHAAVMKTDARSADPAGATVDPYTDADFKVQRRSHRAGSSSSLKETLVQRAESKARAELVHETTQHAQRSQYDCEAAVHLEKYLKADLDVWGFAAWQAKYFPMQGFKGASLPECRDISDLLDPSHINIQATVAQQN